MKRKSLVILLGCESVLLSALAIFTNFFPTIFSSMPAFPFEQIADGLRLLSQTGSIGNGLAVALWVGVSLIPTMLALKTGYSKETAKERIVLFLLSAVMLLALYGMVNPGLFCPMLLGAQKEFMPVIKATLGVTVWSVIVLYIILRLLRMFIGAVFNVLQIVLMRQLPNIAVNVDVPVISIAFTLVVLLASRLLVENKRLRDDNDLFI